MSDTTSAAASAPAPAPAPTSPSIKSRTSADMMHSVDEAEAAQPEPAATPAAAPSTAEPTPTTLPMAPPEAISSSTEPTEDVKESTTEDLPEPQNTLTARFTDAEWKALKELRANLHDILAEGYPDKPTARDTPITLWGVNIDPSNPKDARVSVVLMKFLRARNLSVRDAQSMLVATLRWRDEFNVDATLKEEFPADVFGQLGHVYGHDKNSRPVVYNLYGANKDLKAVFGDVQRFIRWRVALMERSVALLDFTETDQMVQVHDYEGVSLTSRDANSKNAASEATNIFQSHYPELLHKKFFINVPTFLSWIFWVFKPLISPNTLAKMSVVGTGHHAIKKALSPVIEAKELPKRYGGDAEAF